MTNEQAIQQYAAHNDAEAFRVLVQSYQGLVYAAARRRLARAEDAEDVTQQTFLKLAQAAGTIRRNLSSWLYTTALHAATDLIRRDAARQRHETAAALPQDAPAPAEDRSWHELSLIIDEVIRELPEAQRTLIIEHFLHGRSQRELAAELDVSQPTILRRIDTAVASLRQRLQQRGYTAAPAAFAAALAQLVPGDIPASLSAELAKIGLAGSQAHMASAAVVAGGAGATSAGKIALLVCIGGLLLGGAAAGWWLWQPAPQSIVVGPVTAAPAAPAPADPGQALERLGTVYGLAQGENLRRINPPFPAERHAFANAQFPYAKPPLGTPSENLRSIGFRWTNGQFAWHYMRYPDPTLPTIIDSGLRIEWYNVDQLDRIRWTAGTSDWIVRDGLPIGERLDALAKIISSDTGRPWRFEHRVVRRPCILLQGQVRDGPDNGRRFHVVVVTLNPLSETEFRRWVADQRPKDSTHSFDFQPVAQLLDAPFLPARPGGALGNNSLFYIGADARLRHTDPDYRAKLTRVLDNIKSQIGGEWSIEDRDIDVWEPVSQ